MINVILADHQKIFRIGIASALVAEDDIRIVGQPHSLGQLLNGLEKFCARVLILSSAYLGDLDQIKRGAAGRQTAILLLSEKEDAISHEVSAQVQGIIQRSASESTVVQCVRHLARGGRVVRFTHDHSSDIERDSVGVRVRQRLSQLELKIIGFVVQGDTNREIALKMGATEQGIKNALRRIFDKTGVFDRLELALFVLHHEALLGAATEAHASFATNSVAAVQSFRDMGRQPVVNQLGDARLTVRSNVRPIPQ